MKLRHYSIVIALLLLFTGSSFSDEVVAKSSISSVTIYPDRATIVREADISLAVGNHLIVFDNLPVTLIPNSLRVSGKGTAVVKVVGIDLASQYLEAALLPDVKKLQEEIDALQLEMNKTVDRIEVLETQEKFLKSIESANAAQASQEVMLGKPDVQSWERVINFIGRKLGEVKEAKLEQRNMLKEQQVKLQTLQKKLNSIKPQRPTESRKVSVLVEASRDGRFQLDLSYTVTRAQWAPLYTMRAMPDSSEIEFAMSANIVQNSGENWEDAKALLSTASPALSANPPVLNPWILDFYVPRPSRERKVEGGVVGGVLGGVVGEVAKPEAPAEAEMVDAEMATAGIVETGINLNFAVKKNIQIPSDGSPHKVPVDAQDIEVKYDYIAVPKLKEAAFLRAQLRNTLPYPLLSGNADLFVVQDFIGSTRVPFIAAEEEAKVFFGEDRQIRIKHERTKREKSPPGFLGKNERIKLAYKITIQNLRKHKVDIEILDQLPVSQNTKIEIKDLTITPEPAKKDEKGFLNWTLTLEPQEKKEILIGFTIEYPKGAYIRGI
ncbi:MAG: mucoidy inhibitor MuiA family protein [Candidatus Aminicenantes bacterium]|nr:mucoidy inhibitor MuiA family protein [Candidatus Aminicenantes bacterium]MDH5705727.1 mucoidy inhibitor MuiA family protein [Candidatus Aminicenantes bacterium]